MNGKQTLQTNEKWQATVAVMVILLVLCLLPFLYDLYDGWMAR